MVEVFLSSLEHFAFFEADMSTQKFTEAVQGRGVRALKPAGEQPKLLVILLYPLHQFALAVFFQHGQQAVFLDQKMRIKLG